ncbi:hypothetical protein [Adhaeribacter pallidiroseus]|uniref:Uncharacterized protein n=1 Tax=Adhaeribacter pallidiroseus TaxID=2072847 RepID=A0A369QKB8_9BACT|nr:hypothetical protein [Adhaeribacter pallidiroseus]RDC63299.1 hypothetical protein AHMF7616_01901 [Adhaeribacter pallidiroseus]
MARAHQAKTPEELAAKYAQRSVNFRDETEHQLLFDTQAISKVLAEQPLLEPAVRTLLRKLQACIQNEVNFRRRNA